MSCRLKKIQKIDKIDTKRQGTAMLLRFTFENFMSIRDETEISLMGTAIKDRQNDVLETRYSRHGVLPTLALYGANASGKSNALHALRTFRRLVLQSFGNAEEGLFYEPFALDDESAFKPTKFVLDFVNNDTRYQYGLVYDKNSVHQEWLYAYPKQIQQILFVRDKDTSPEYHFGRYLSGNNKAVQAVTRPNTLFLSAAHASGHTLLEEVFTFIRKKIQFASTNRPFEDIFKELHGNSNLKQKTEELLCFADTGVANIQIREQPTKITDSLTELYGLVSKLTGSKEIQPPTTEFVGKLGHTASGGKIKPLKLDDESWGTRQLLTLLPAILNSLAEGTTLILDEITTSLHTLLSRRLVSLFVSKKTNQYGAQLLFTTHDTNLLADHLLRRDEIWFAEKSPEGTSTIYPLIEINTKNTDNIEKGYIQGRFGAIPYLKKDEE